MPSHRGTRLGRTPGWWPITHTTTTKQDDAAIWVSHKHNKLIQSDRAAHPIQLGIGRQDRGQPVAEGVERSGCCGTTGTRTVLADSTAWGSRIHGTYPSPKPICEIRFQKHAYCTHKSTPRGSNLTEPISSTFSTIGITGATGETQSWLTYGYSNCKIRICPVSWEHSRSTHTWLSWVGFPRWSGTVNRGL